MSNWIFITTNRKVDDHVYTAREIYQQRMQDGFWGLAERTPNRTNLEPGDRVVFYLGTSARVFAGTAIVDSPSYKLSELERERVSHGNVAVFHTE